MMTPTNCLARAIRIWPIALVLLTRPAGAITLGMIDTFQDGTSQAWAGATVVNVPNAGPLGAGDNALEAANGGKGIVVRNEMQWQGDYLTAGVTKVSMDVQNPNAFDLELRLGISKGMAPSAFGFGPTYVSINSLTVPQGGAWHHVTFGLTPTDIEPTVTNTESSPNTTAALSDVFQFRILHNPFAKDFTGTGVGSFLLDNIKAEGDAPVADADFDGDDDVDGADFLIWQRGLGVGTTPGMGDADGNGVVNADDLAVWKMQFGGAPAGAAASAVPEPTGLLFGVVGLWGLVSLHERRLKA